MKKAVGFAALAAVLVGCSSPAPEAAPEAKPAPTASVTPTATTPAAATSAATTPAATNPDVNPNRVFQLNSLKKVDVDIKGHKMHLWVMDDEDKQQEGMMFLKDGDVKADEGMLFAFGEVQKKMGSNGKPLGFWMHHTLIPLDIVYFSPAGKVINIAHGKVEDDTTLPAGGDFLNVIELKAGTAARFGLKLGDSVSIPTIKKP